MPNNFSVNSAESAPVDLAAKAAPLLKIMLQPGGMALIKETQIRVKAKDKELQQNQSLDNIQTQLAVLEEDLPMDDAGQKTMSSIWSQLEPFLLLKKQASTKQKAEALKQQFDDIVEYCVLVKRGQLVELITFHSEKHTPEEEYKVWDDLDWGSACRVWSVS